METVTLNIDRSRWDSYITTKPTALFSHFYDWADTISTIYGLQAFFLATERKGLITGILPLVLFPAPHRDVRLLSLPYTDAAGLISDNIKTTNLLLQAGLDLAKKLGALHLELRQGQIITPAMIPEKSVWSPPQPHRFKTGLARSLPASVDLLWLNLGPKVRNQVRKAKKNKLYAKTGNKELMEDFFAVFSENMRDLGSPVHSFEFLAMTVEKLASRVFIVYLKKTPMAGAIVFLKDEILFNPWASSLRRYRPLCANMLLYWTMLSFAVKNGYTRFDFGRSSPEASTCRFKTQWGAQMSPLAWNVISQKPFSWSPLNESLVDEKWKSVDLATSIRSGPAIRKWLSL